MYNMRQIKKLTWLQDCILGDVEVIWCNSLDDSLFQIYVMNFVEIVLDFYLHITSHVSQVFTSCTHYTSHVPWFWCNMCLMFEFWRQIGWNTCFWKIWVEFKCFWKTFNLILMHFIHEILYFEEFCIKLLCFSKI